jgi:hypothetical protein
VSLGTITAVATAGTALATLVLAFFTWRSVRASSRLIESEEKKQVAEYAAAFQAVYLELLGIAQPLRYLLDGRPVEVPMGFGAYQQMLARLYARLPTEVGVKLAETYNKISIRRTGWDELTKAKPQITKSIYNNDLIETLKAMRELANRQPLKALQIDLPAPPEAFTKQLQAGGPVKQGIAE